MKMGLGYNKGQGHYLKIITPSQGGFWHDLGATEEEAKASLYNLLEGVVTVIDKFDEAKAYRTNENYIIYDSKLNEQY